MLKLAAPCQCAECREIDAIDRAIFNALRTYEAIKALELAKAQKRNSNVRRFPLELTRAKGQL